MAKAAERRDALLPPPAPTAAPGEEASGAACFQRASLHYHSHSHGAVQTVALNIHGKPTFMAFHPPPTRPNIMQIERLRSKFGIKASQQSRIPMYIPRFISRVCVCACRPLALISNGGTLQRAQTLQGEMRASTMLMLHHPTLTHYPRWKSPGTKCAAEIPIPCKSGVAAASRGVPPCRGSHRRFPRKALASFRRRRVTMCVFAVVFFSLFSTSGAAVCPSTVVCTDGGIVLWFFASPTPASFWGNCHENYIYVSILTGGVLIELKKHDSLLLSIYCHIKYVSVCYSKCYS